MNARVNQFDGFMGPIQAKQFFKQPSRGQSFAQMVDVLESFPDDCVVPPYRHMTFQRGGKRHKASFRALAYYYTYGYVPERGFAIASCGTAGCVNPRHQVPWQKKEPDVAPATSEVIREEKVGAFTVTSPRTPNKMVAAE